LDCATDLDAAIGSKLEAEADNLLSTYPGHSREKVDVRNEETD